MKLEEAKNHPKFNPSKIKPHEDHNEIVKFTKKSKSKDTEPHIQGLTVCDMVHQNFAFLYGCKPSIGVNADTTMVTDVIKTLLNRFDRNELTVSIPDVFDSMKGRDATFEMVTSNTI